MFTPSALPFHRHQIPFVYTKYLLFPISTNKGYLYLVTLTCWLSL
jgi:hypothetical protein